MGWACVDSFKYKPWSQCSPNTVWPWWHRSQASVSSFGGWANDSLQCMIPPQSTSSTLFHIMFPLPCVHQTQLSCLSFCFSNTPRSISSQNFWKPLPTVIPMTGSFTHCRSHSNLTLWRGLSWPNNSKYLLPSIQVSFFTLIYYSHKICCSLKLPCLCIFLHWLNKNFSISLSEIVPHTSPISLSLVLIV